MKPQMIGSRFDRLVVIQHLGTDSKKNNLWLCRCDCGGEARTRTFMLTNGRTRSCGCLQKEQARALVMSRSTHLCSKGNITYRSWKEMRQRCLNPNSDKWKWYGGRGISIDTRRDSFEVFLADMGERPTGCTLDRRDSDGNYSKQNCRWATPKEQATTNRGCFRPGSNSFKGVAR